jgi:hypothetical protein
MIKKSKQTLKKKHEIRKKILSLTLLSFILLSCGKIDDNSRCYLKHRNGENLYMISNNSNKVEVIINYKMHAMNHDSTMSNIPCRYRVSWIGESGANKSDLVYTDKKLFKQ